MDLKNLLSKLDILEGTMKAAEKEHTGPEFTGYWKGSDKGTPGKKMVGGSEQQESILKDLSKGPKPKTKDQELAEQYAAYLQALEEENIGTNEKRPLRQGSRPARDYGKTGEHSKRYHYNEETGQQLTVIVDRKGRERPVTGTMEELLEYFGYTLETGKSYEHERGRHKINMAPKNVNQLVDALNKAASNAAANSAPNTYYYVGEDTNESRGHKIIATKLANLERMKNVQIPTPQERKAELEKAKTNKDKKEIKESNQPDAITVDVPLLIRLLEYAREDAKTDMDLHNVAERLIALSGSSDVLGMEQYDDIVANEQLDELYGASNPVQGAQNQTVGQQQTQVQPTDANKAAAAATQQLKSITQTAAPAPKLGQAIAATTTGQAVNPTDMKVLQPLMKDVATIAQDPKLVNQFKSLANQANQAQKKQQAQQQAGTQE